jgi:nitrate/TMAO reductase-like tetraheme cytochrome c subunit
MNALRTALRRLVPLTVVVALAVVLAWANGGVALAQDAEDEQKPCASCHSDQEDAWKASSHATTIDPVTGKPSATCESCHGEYVRGHPDEAMEPLRVDSSSCEGCHEDLFAQWESSLHGVEGVQCISCHIPHSQEMRLTDERLCSSCHKESLDDSLHQAHWAADTACTECHMAGGTQGAQIADVSLAAAVVHGPSHDFVTVSARGCLECHREEVSSGAVLEDGSTQISFAPGLPEPDIVAQLEGAQQVNRRLTVFSVANLGFGLGFGGILGILFMVTYARFGTRRSNND